MHLHHPVDPLGIGRRRSAIACLPPQERMDPAVAIGRQFGDQSLDTRDEIFLGQRRSAAAARRGLAPGRQEMLPRDAERVRHLAHRSPSGNESVRNAVFWGPATREIAPRRISFSMVFLPSMRCSSRTWFSSARYSLAGTTSPPARVAVRAPLAACRRQPNSCWALPHARAPQATRCYRSNSSLRPC